MLSGFDHVTLVVHDVPEAVAQYTKLLGSAPTWRGEHAEHGTRAALFGLPNAMIELVGPIPDAPEADALRELLQLRGEGLQAIAFATDEAGVCSKSLRDRGLRATPAQPGEARGVDGTTRTYQTVELSARTTRGIAVLAVERNDARVLRGERAPLAGAVCALDHVVVRTAEPEAAIALYGTGLGIRLALDREFAGTRMLFFRIGGVTLEVVQDSACGDADRLWGLAYRVADLGAAHAQLTAAGFGPSPIRDGNKPGTQVFTLHAGTCGVPTLILRDPSRE